MQKNHVSLADFLPPDHPLCQVLRQPADSGSADSFIRAFNEGRAFAKTVLHVPDSAHDPAPLQEGSRVRIENLQASAAMNGRTGVICSAFNRESGRWTVEVDADGASLPCRLSIRAANLKAIQTSSADAIPTRHHDNIASVSTSAADSGSADGLNADPAYAPAPLQEGSRVRIENLQACAAMNGRTGVICSAFNRESGRWTVEVDADGASLPCRLSIRAANLKAIQTSSADAIPNFASQWMDEDGRVWAREVDFLRQCPKGHALTKFHRDVFDVNAKQLLCRICHTTCLCNSDCAAEWNVCSVVSGCCFGYAVCSSCASASSVAAAPSTGAGDHVRTQVGDDIRISVKIACCQSA
jgi:hypothetical protein